MSIPIDHFVLGATLPWYSTNTAEEVDRAANAWEGNDAPDQNLEVFAMILDVAKTQVLAYAPAPPEGTDWTAAAPPRFVLAQLKHATDLWNAGRASSSSGEGEWSFVPRPLDKVTKGIIRPVDGKPDAF